MPRRERLRHATGAAAIVSLCGGLFTGLAPAPAAAHGPSAGAVAHSKQVVAALQHRLESATLRVAAAEVRARTLGEKADAASEAYDGARVKLQAAQQQLGTAELVLRSANQRVIAGEQEVGRFATAAYESGGLSTVNAILETDGTQRLITRFGDIDAISSADRETVQQLAAARVYQGAVQQRALSVQRQAAGAAAAAARTKLAAERAATAQQSLLSRLNAAKQRLYRMVASAEAHASALQRERIAAILAARQAAARRAAQASQPTAVAGPTPYANATGSTSGTVSAGTAAAAVREAESQMGKPYQWGAAGPSSYDCSGLVMWAYAQVGVHLDHWTGDQWNEGAHVSRSALRPGDLVFFAYNTSDPSSIHHVGMYIGGGQMVEAPYTGANVRISGAFRSDYIGAVRPYQR